MPQAGHPKKNSCIVKTRCTTSTENKESWQHHQRLSEVHTRITTAKLTTPDPALTTCIRTDINPEAPRLSIIPARGGRVFLPFSTPNTKPPSSCKSLNDLYLPL